MRSEQLKISQAMKDVQASSLPPDVKADYLDHAAIDLGWQHNDSGKPVVAWPLGTLGTEEPLTWVKLGKADCYSAFVKLGRGMGGSSRPSRIMAHQKACPSHKQWCMGTFSEGPRHAPTHCEQKYLGAMFSSYTFCVGACLLIVIRIQTNILVFVC